MAAPDDGQTWPPSRQLHGYMPRQSALACCHPHNRDLEGHWREQETRGCASGAVGRAPHQHLALSGDSQAMVKAGCRLADASCHFVQVGRVNTVLVGPRLGQKRGAVHAPRVQPIDSGGQRKAPAAGGGPAERHSGGHRHRGRRCQLVAVVGLHAARRLVGQEATLEQHGGWSCGGREAAGGRWQPQRRRDGRSALMDACHWLCGSRCGRQACARQREPRSNRLRSPPALT